MLALQQQRQQHQHQQHQQQHSLETELEVFPAKDDSYEIAEPAYCALIHHAKLPQPRTSYKHMIKLVLISFYVDLYA
ncbi:hypothetical protein M0804_003495 [Polistes exclamans]|nr:hypothetical protein M0804_003495 [Polistes exclamans]